MTTQTCEHCNTDVHPLEVFPGSAANTVRCLDCYASSPEGRYIPTADELTAMWGGGRR